MSGWKNQQKITKNTCWGPNLLWPWTKNLRAWLLTQAARRWVHQAPFIMLNFEVGISWKGWWTAVCKIYRAVRRCETLNLNALLFNAAPWSWHQSTFMSHPVQSFLMASLRTNTSKQLLLVDERRDLFEFLYWEEKTQLCVITRKFHVWVCINSLPYMKRIFWLGLINSTSTNPYSGVMKFELLTSCEPRVSLRMS